MLIANIIMIDKRIAAFAYSGIVFENSSISKLPTIACNTYTEKLKYDICLTMQFILLFSNIAFASLKITNNVTAYITEIKYPSELLNTLNPQTNPTKFTNCMIDICAKLILFCVYCPISNPIIITPAYGILYCKTPITGKVP